MDGHLLSVASALTGEDDDTVDNLGHQHPSTVGISGRVADI